MEVIPLGEEVESTVPRPPSFRFRNAQMSKLERQVGCIFHQPPATQND